MFLFYLNYHFGGVWNQCLSCFMQDWWFLGCLGPLQFLATGHISREQWRQPASWSNTFMTKKRALSSGMLTEIPMGELAWPTDEWGAKTNAYAPDSWIFWGGHCFLAQTSLFSMQLDVLFQEFCTNFLIVYSKLLPEVCSMHSVLSYQW